MKRIATAMMKDVPLSMSRAQVLKGGYLYLCCYFGVFRPLETGISYHEEWDEEGRSAPSLGSR